MKRTVKRILAVLLTAVMLLSVAPMSGIDLAPKASAKDISSYSVGDIITFGSYPQSKVTDSDLIAKIEATGKSISWVDYNYYAGTGDWRDGNMKPVDGMMLYKDIPYNGNKYRAVKINQYRPCETGDTSSASYTVQDDNGYYTGNVYYFKYEPLTWRVLDPSEGYVMCNQTIDSQAYQNFIYYNGSEYYNSKGCTNYASDWVTSSLRQWLNNDFYNTAFSVEEKEQIGTSHLENKSIHSSAYDSADTYDKIFLISYYDATNSAYDFNSSNRQMKGTDYAKCQGLWVSTSSSYSRNSLWWLRSPSDSDDAPAVSDGGWADSYCDHVNITYRGVVPAFKFNPKSTIPEDYDETTYKNVKVNFENKNSWGNYKIGVTALNFDPSWFNSDSSIYNHQMAQLASQFAMIGYTKKDGGKQPYLEKALNAIGFDDIELQPHAGRDEVNYFIASKKIKVGATVYNLVFTGFIGSNGKQWDSNFDPYAKESSTNYSDKKDLKGLVHLGFNDAKNYAYNKLKKYVEERGFSKDNTKILITGHSRGAATANLVAAKLIDEQNLAYSRNIFTFAFATPNSAKKQITDKPGNDYSRIFNIINPEDFVVKVLPTSWDFDKFGTTYTLPSITNDKKWYVHTAAMQMFFSEFTDGGICDKYVKGDSVPNAVVNRLTKYVNNLDEFYEKPIQISLVPGLAIKPFDYFKHTLCPFVNGSDDKTEALEFVSAFLGSDPMQLLLYSRVTGFFLANGNGVLSQNFADAHLAETYCAYMMAMNKQDIQWKRTSLLNTVNCPVDIEVYDKSTGELVGRIVNNVVDETVAAKENAIVMDVDGDSKMFYLPTNGDYDVKLIGNDNGKMDYTVATIDSDIGETSRVNFFDVDIIKGQSMTGEVIADEFILENYTLEKEEGEVLEPTEVQEDIESFEVKTSTDGNGYVTESMTVTSGDYVTVSATPKEGYAFKGWYNGDELTSSDNEYSFVAKNNITLTAKFAPIPKNVKSVSIDDISLNYKKSTTLKPTIKADDGAKYKVEYSTSNAKIATVDQNGKVTATKRGSGTATITCTVTDSNGNVVKDTCKVNVSLTWWQWIIIIVLFGWIWY